MKKTALRVWSVLLCLCMMTGLFATVAFADEIVITQPPVDVTAEKGGTATLTVQAEGEDLTYYWYCEPWRDLEADERFSGVHTSSLTMTNASCSFNDYEFYCVVETDYSWAQSESARITVPHAEMAPENFLMDSAAHLEFCVDCMTHHGRAAHEWVGDGAVCGVCGYDAQNPVYTAPVFLNGYLNENTLPGEPLSFYVDVFGEDVTYQWYKQKIPEGDGAEPEARIELTDGDVYSGVTTECLTIEEVTCDMNGYFFICEATNDAGMAVSNSSLYVNHVIDEYKPYDSAEHKSYCVCGAEQGTEYHEDDDCNGVCDVCAYTFLAGAPKITKQPKSVKVQNGHEDVKLTVEATGDNLTYQWYEMGSPVEAGGRFSGTKTATLTIKSVYDAESDVYDCNFWYGGFYCVISNEKGAVSSDVASYNVEHAEVERYELWDEYYHECYCICGDWIEDLAHVDKDEDGECDLCGDEMFELFPDVSAEAWYYEAAVYGKASGIFIGDDQGKFLPDQALTRGQAATVLSRIAFTEEWLSELDDETYADYLNLYNDDELNVEFTDIEGKYYERHVQMLAAIGVINGYEDGSFQGEKKITREELAALLVRFLDVVTGGYVDDMEIAVPVESFEDIDEVAEWAEDEVELARKTGLFRGDEHANLMPKANSTRAQMAETLNRIGFPTGIFLGE